MEKYLEFKALDFAEDPQFIAWVQEGQKENNGNTWLVLQAKSEELDKEIQEAIEIVSIFHIKKDEPSNQAKEDSIFERIEQSIDKENKTTTSNITRSKIGIIRFLIPAAIAAAIAALVIFYIPSQKLKTFASSNQSKIEYTLPDNSSILLDANSSISYDDDNFKNIRRVKLDGQAFFKIEKGNAFIVETEYGTVEVLGTTFNVNTKDGLFVHCVTGKVKVTVDKKSTINTKGEMSFIKDGILTKKESSMEDLKWKHERFQFENKKLAEVLKSIEEEYHVNIQSVKEVNNLVYTGFFETDNLDKALQAVTWPLRLSYEIKGDSIIIKQ